MIKLSLPVLEEPLSIKGMTVLAIENQALYSNLIESLFSYDENSKIALYDFKGDNLSKNQMVMILDMLNYDLNSNSTRKMVYSDLKDILNDDLNMKNELENLMIKIETIIDTLLVDHYLDLQSNELSINDLFKSMNVKVSNNSRTIYDKILDIIEVAKYLNRIKLLIFVNISLFLSEKEWLLLKELIDSNEQNVLFIERLNLSNQTNYLIDEDLYLFKK